MTESKRPWLLLPHEVGESLPDALLRAQIRSAEHVREDREREGDAEHRRMSKQSAIVRPESIDLRGHELLDGVGDHVLESLGASDGDQLPKEQGITSRSLGESGQLVPRIGNISVDASRRTVASPWSSGFRLSVNAPPPPRG